MNAEQDEAASFLIGRLLHAAVGHGNDEKFLTKYFRSELAEFASRIAAEAKAEEREACAKVAEDGFGAEPVSVSSYIADKIRKRGTP